MTLSLSQKLGVTTFSAQVRISWCTIVCTPSTAPMRAPFLAAHVAAMLVTVLLMSHGMLFSLLFLGLHCIGLSHLVGKPIVTGDIVKETDKPGSKVNKTEVAGAVTIKAPRGLGALRTAWTKHIGEKCKRRLYKNQ